MNKIKKSLLTGIAGLVLVSLSGCGNPNTITFWNPLTGDDGAYMDNMVEAYNETDPEFPVESVISPDMYTKVYTVMNSGEGVPDLTLIHADRVPGFVKLGMLESVESLMENNPNLNVDNYLEQAWAPGTVDDTQYTIPLDIHGSAMYYNVDLLEKYGVSNFLDDDVVTFEELLSLEGKLDEGQYAINNALIEWTTLANVVNLGGDIELDGKPTIDTPEMKEVVGQLHDLADAGLITPNGEDGYAIFQGGDVLFSTDGTWTSTAHDSIETLNWGVTNTYAFEPETFNNRSSAHLFSMLENEERTDEKEQGIADFLNYVRENSMEWAKAGQIVASRDVFEDPEYEQYPQSFFTSSEEEQQSLHIFEYEHYGYVEQALATVLVDMIYGNIEIEDGLVQAQRQVEDLVAQGGAGEVAAEEAEAEAEAE
ncbi:MULTISPECIES: extracellular solute-binding protein [Carnobacterium]|uniref:extracellular solute-binding protein n=1 Tax=Carnobacterium TaxID=2747 RepID=UPI00203E4509|nr:extracellular solute-binding protein [Carnobacterium inhibens]MCM3513283.1 extracellular solute-binding protein [Carnobacterium inhibens]